jgi:hypothetical protein
MSQILSDGHRPQVGLGAGRRNRAIARVGLRHGLTSDSAEISVAGAAAKVHLGPRKTLVFFRNRMARCSLNCVSTDTLPNSRMESADTPHLKARPVLSSHGSR